MATGIILACPVWLYQIWAFITRACGKKETPVRAPRSWSSAAAAFVSGAVLAYVGCPRPCTFLLTVGSDVQVTALSGDQYFGFPIPLLIGVRHRLRVPAADRSC